ncbi:tyrosine-type recombinase/integrase [Stieleria tagensis]|uniref:tyrosine-type recombinase/integrase n=1 Tax=Stieleria tagensis TaxID=2956795 RepID=UPI00209A97D2|nr:site-specific integrase [Stieleria tagensis]
MQTGELTAGKDGSPRIKVKSSRWTAKYRNGEGVVFEVSTGCSDRDAANSVLNDLVRRSEQVKSKILTADQAAIAEHQSTLLSDHIATYVDHLKARNVHADRIKTMETRMKQSAEGCGFRWLSDMNVDRFEKWLGELREEPEEQDADKMPKPVSASVYNGFVESWVAFGFWCVGKRMAGKRSHMNGDKRMLTNPFEGMRRLDPKQDRRRTARALTEKELTDLLDAARRRPLRDAMTVRTGKNKGKQLAKVADRRRLELKQLGHERAMIYKTLVLTGLRVNELRTLACQDLSFGDVPFVKLRHSNEKSRKGSTVALRSDLAAELREWIQGREPSARVFNVPAGMLRIMDRDLKLAGIEKESDGSVVHIHALRHSFGTHLSKAGVAPRVAQAAMRHSDISLTMNTYTDARLLDTAEAVEALPELKIPTDNTDLNCSSVSPADAPADAPTPGQRGHFESIPDQLGECEDDALNKEKPRETQGFTGFDAVGATRFELATSTSRTFLACENEFGQRIISRLRVKSYGSTELWPLGGVSCGHLPVHLNVIFRLISSVGTGYE